MPNSRIRPHIESLYTAYVEPATWVALGVPRRMEGQSASLEGHQAVPAVIGHFGKITSEQAHNARWMQQLKNRIAREIHPLCVCLFIFIGPRYIYPSVSKGRVQKPQARKLSVGGVPPPAPGASTDEIFPKS